MTDAAGVGLRVGSRVWFDGQGWEVSELTGASARLHAGGAVRTVSVSSLVGSTVDAKQPDPSAASPDWDIPAVVVAGLSSAQMSSLNARVEALRRVLEPAVGDERAILQRYDAEAASLEVSRRTLQRQAS